MSMYYQFVSELIRQPLLIEPSAAEALFSVMAGARDRKDAEVSLIDILMGGTGEEPTDAGPSVAIIPVHGTLSQRSWWRTSYTRLERDIRAAVEDAAVSSVVLDISSPGGEAAGVFDFTDRLAAMAQEKRIVAVVNELAASGAYAIACACSEVVVPRTGEVGSVGVVKAHTDISRAMEDAGLKVTLIHAGARKVDQHPQRPLSPRARSRMQSEVDDLYDIFVATVAQNRNMDPEAVRETEAGMFMGQAAVDVGLADRVGTLHEVVESLSAAADRSSVRSDKRTPSMTTQTPKATAETPLVPETPEVPATPAAKPAPAVQFDAAAVVELCNQHNASEMAPGFLRDGKTLEEVKTHLGYVSEVRNLCKTAGFPDAADEFITAEASIEGVSKALIERMANRKPETAAPDTTTDEIDNKVTLQGVPMGSSKSDAIWTEALKSAGATLKQAPGTV